MAKIMIMGNSWLKKRKRAKIISQQWTAKFPVIYSTIRSLVQQHVWQIQHLRHASATSKRSCSIAQRYRKINKLEEQNHKFQKVDSLLKKFIGFFYKVSKRINRRRNAI